MHEVPIHFIDFEGSRQSGVVEYGFVTLLRGQIVDSQTRVCSPVGRITDVDRGQHGISEELAAREPLFETEWSLFADLRESGPFCAHNAVVEDRFLRAVWPYPRTSPDFSKEGKCIPSWGPWLDTLHLYRRIYPQLESHKLSVLIQAFDLQVRLDLQASELCPPERCRFHCALYDALASALLLQRLDEESELREASLRWLFLQSAGSESTREAMGQQELL